MKPVYIRKNCRHSGIKKKIILRHGSLPDPVVILKNINGY